MVALRIVLGTNAKLKASDTKILSLAHGLFCSCSGAFDHITCSLFKTFFGIKLSFKATTYIIFDIKTNIDFCSMLLSNYF